MIALRARVIRTLLGFYPQEWRREYGPELEDMLERRRLGVRTVVDVIAGALRINAAGRAGLAPMSLIGATSLAAVWLGRSVLAELSAVIGVRVLDWAGIPALYTSGAIEYVHRVRTVSDICGGAAFLCSLVPAVLVYAFWFERDRQLRCLLLTAAVPCALLAGTVMVVGTSVSGNEVLVSLLSLELTLMCLAAAHRLPGKTLRRRKRGSCG